MKRYLPHVLTIAVVALLMASCKLDKPILPGQKGYVAYTPPGGGDTTGTGTGTGGTGIGGSTKIDTTLLTGSWKVKTTYVGDIQDGKFNQGTQSPYAVIPDVDMNSKTLIGTFGADVGIVTDNPYVPLVANSNFYITFETDPFPRSTNDKIQVSALSATSMTWIAIDPQVTTAAGHTFQTAITVVFGK